MADRRTNIVFAGDESDPYAHAIATALPSETLRIPRLGFLPPDWSAGDATGRRVLVLHCSVLSRSEMERLAQVRRSQCIDQVILCTGPHVRYHQVQPLLDTLVDCVLPEATAAETVQRHVGSASQPVPTPRPRVVIVSGGFEMREALADSCRAAGFHADGARNWLEASSVPLAVWEVPLLEPAWETILSQESVTRSILTLVGLADREIIERARAAGAAACLDLPVDPADLAFVLDRLASYWPSAGLEQHASPSSPAIRDDRKTMAEERPLRKMCHVGKSGARLAELDHP